MEEISDGPAWLEYQRRIRRTEPILGHWSHTYLGLAVKLWNQGRLKTAVLPPSRWASDRKQATHRFGGLLDENKRWLVDQAATLVALSRIPDDPVGLCAKYFLDWTIWYRTADGCHPTTLTVRRDALKYDLRSLWWTPAAGEALERARTAGVAPSKVVEHEHIIPKRVLVGLMLRDEVSVEAAMNSYAMAALVTPAEHKRLNAAFPHSMPAGWTPKRAGRAASADDDTDAFARYASVGLKLNPPLGS